MRKPSIPPAGPPRDSQSSIRTTQPTPIIVPKPKVKYSTVLRPPRSRVTRRTIPQRIGIASHGCHENTKARNKYVFFVFS